MAPESLLFTPSNIGPLTLRSRTIRTADFEGMCIDNGPSEALYQYHTSVAAGEIGMTTATYAAVNRSGLSFPTQLWMRPGIIPGFFPYPPDTFNRFERYACSKLVFTLCSLRVSYLCQEEGISINMVDPGIVNTSIIKMHKWVDPLADILFRPVIRHVPRGASTTVFLALDHSLEGVSGKLFKDKKPVKLPSWLKALQALDSVWSFFITLNTYGNKQ